MLNPMDSMPMKIHFPPESAPVLRALPLFALSPLSWMMLQDLWVNTFGLDRGGARALLLAPSTPVRLLGGKNAAVAMVATALFLVACAPYLARALASVRK